MKEEADHTLADIGMNTTTALTIFIKTMVRQNRIPFNVAGDRFYEESSQEWLRQALADARSDKGIVT